MLLGMKKPGLIPGMVVNRYGILPPFTFIPKKVVAIHRNIAYNICEPKGSQRVFRHPYPKCEALQQVFRHLYPKCGALTIRGDENPLVFCERK